MCVTYLVVLVRGDVINKKFLGVILIVVIVLIIIMPINSTQDFDGLFTMNVPLTQHYSNVAWCRANGALGCANEYWEDSAGCEIDGDEMVIYYYNGSLLGSGESNTLKHVLNGLTTSYLYELNKTDGDLIILTNDISMRNMPTYLVGKQNEGGSEVVFVGGYDLDNLKNHANSVKFK